MGFTPKLLLIAIASIASNKNVEDDEILKHYFKQLLPDFLEALNRQLKSLDVAKREAGEYALQEVSQSELDELNPVSLFIIKPETATPILEYHLAGLKAILNEADAIKKKYRGKGETLTDIISNLVPDLISEVKDLALLFLDDLSLN